MAIPAPNPEASSTPSTGLTLPTIPAVPLSAAQLPEFVDDFFRWLRDEWQLPVLSSHPSPPPLNFPPRLLDTEAYTLPELCQIWGWSHDKVRNDLSLFHVPSSGSRLGPKRRPWSTYRGQDLMPAVQHWEWQRLHDHVLAHWRPLFHDPCGSCANCQLFDPETEQGLTHCAKNMNRTRYRIFFSSLLKGIREHGSIAAWWRLAFQAWQADPSTPLPEGSGLVLYYLLDRHYLALSWEEMIIIFPLRGVGLDDLGRPWRHRKQNEHATFLNAMARLRRAESASVRALGCLTLLFLQFGLKGVTELSRQLTSEEIEAAVKKGCLLTTHLYADVCLPIPQSPDIQLGHLLLDTLRAFIWKHQSTVVDRKQRGSQDVWPHSLELDTINAVEQALYSHLWYGTQGVLVPRQETKGQIFNRYLLQQEAEQKGLALSQLPTFLQEQITAFISKRYQEDRRVPHTLTNAIMTILIFLRFAQQKFGLERINKWDRKQCVQIFEAFKNQVYKDVTDEYRQRRFKTLLAWFDTLGDLGFSVPPGYRVLHKFIQPLKEQERDVPPEALLNRVFHDGVCQLRDPYSRLALTIQFFCGTRIQETLDMHLFCIWVDEDRRGFLTIPIGKSKEERKFPIIPESMELLTNLIEEVTKLHFSSGQIRPRVQANYNYLATDLVKATSWLYLFDRFTYNKYERRAVLSQKTVGINLKEAILLAAQVDPSKLFVEGTYNQRCQRQAKSGKHCKYLAMRAGVTTCPICGGKLTGTRGERCRRTLKTDYVCNGVATEGAWFCPVCDGPLAQPIHITTHDFRHNSVTRASRRGMPLEHNMAIHGQNTVRIHMLYNHPELRELYEKTQGVMEVMYFREAQMQGLITPGQVVVEGIAQNPSLQQYLGLTLSRSWQRETSGIWGGFVATMLSDEGVQSPVPGRAKIIITDDTYALTVAQYRYEALGLAISEVSLEFRTRGKHCAQVPSYLNRQAIEQLVTQHPALNKELNGNLTISLIQGEIERQRARLTDLAARLQPWWNHYGSIDQLIIALTPTNTDPFYQEVNDGA